MTDTGEGIDIRVAFDPPINSASYVGGSQWLAAEMLKVASKIMQQIADDESEEV